MKTPVALLTMAALPLSILAADATRTWKADFDTQRGLQKYTFTFKQDGANVTGKASVETDGEKREAELKEGKVAGDTVSFVEPLSIQGNDINVTFTGKISGEEIKFTRAVGDFGSSEATAKRDAAMLLRTGGSATRADECGGGESRGVRRARRTGRSRRRWRGGAPHLDLTTSSLCLLRLRLQQGAR